MSDQWFQEQIAPDGVNEDGCHPDEARALQDYLHQKTGVSEAAKAIVQPIEQSANPGAHLYRLWNLLIDALIQLPETQITPLIQLLDAIQNLPEPDLTGKTTEDTPLDGHLWQGLPGFGHMWADGHKQGHWRGALAAEKGPRRTEMRSAHVRKANLEARLAVAGISNIPFDWGYECIADALERQDAVVDLEVPAAAEWIAVAGDRLYAGVRTGCKSWALESRRDFGREAPVMTLERWLFWEQRMEELDKQLQAEGEATQSAHHVMKTTRQGGDG
ncbi:MAG: hypothetical protein LQ339_007637 [Xanthoria mediterranea]|nr:MAG: hypothetical protein LQ339_007637 [Xanthoria mediterranea]